MLFLKLILAHILGDFVLQSNNWVEKRKNNVIYLLLHVFVHLLVLVLLLLPDLRSYWLLILFIVISHLAIDSFKIWLEKKANLKPIVLFVGDQLLHFIVILGVLYYIYGIPASLVAIIFSAKSLLYLLAFLIICFVSPIFISVLFSKWNQDSEFIMKRSDSLMNAGLFIGIIERLIIVLFLQVGFLSGIGILLAAKSIFRFGDLTNAKDTKFTEYVLLGTLVSFLIAIVVGYLLRLGLKII